MKFAVGGAQSTSTYSGGST